MEVLEGGGDLKGISSSSTETVAAAPIMDKTENDALRVKRKALQAVLDRCQRALELLSEDGNSSDGGRGTDEDESIDRSGSVDRDVETDELCDMIKSRVECPAFLQKLENAQASVYLNVNEESSSWDVVSENDLWECDNADSEQEDYVLVRQEDIVEGIACFMAAYLLSLKDSKDLTPNQLQDALRKTFSLKKRKGKLRKAWDGSKVIYNVASWSATAIGIYQNPALLRAASTAFWTSCRVISKLF